MRRSHSREHGKGALELIEEAVHMLRAAPVGTLAFYYLGTLPFVLGILYFWADMSRSAFAHQHLAEGALGLAGLFLWMKFWQAIFARGLRAQLEGEPPPTLSFSRCRRIFITQAALQPTGLFVLPLALIAALPFGWVYAFYQNVTALADGESAELRKMATRAQQQATLWPRSNHAVLAVMFAFGLFVFLNWTTVGLVLPKLVKMLFGVESILTRSGWSLLNTTFLAAMLGLTYLCTDPILKAIYALRCFYGESLQSGEDLRTELRQLTVSAQGLMRCVLLALVVAMSYEGQDARGESVPKAEGAPVAQPSVSPTELDRTIGEVIQQRKYAWRLPREKVAETEDQGILGRFLERTGKMLRKWMRATQEWLRKLFQRDRRSAGGGAGYGWILSLEILMYVLLGLVVAGLGVMIYRAWRARQRGQVVVASEPVQPAPDLREDDVGADELPEDGWTKLGRELLEQGEFRLALRAFYLASLAHLAKRNLITLAKFKSNREYENELKRRAHAFPETLQVFGENVTIFDRIWYGMHEANLEIVTSFASQVERLKAGA